MYFYGISSDSVSSFFGQHNTYSNKNQSNHAFSSLYSSLGDYSTIRSGSYSKLIKSYYAKKSDTTIDKNNNTTNETSKDKAIASNASALKSSAEALSSSEFTNETKENLTKSINSFVSSYNEVISSAKNSTNHSVQQKYDSLTNLTKRYTSLLNSVGVQVNSDHSLSIEKETLANADVSTLKSTFSGSYSYTAQVSNYASLIYSANSNGVDSIYTSGGTISTMSTSSILDTFA